MRVYQKSTCWRSSSTVVRASSIMLRCIKESHFSGDDVGRGAEEEDSRPLETKSKRFILC